MEKEESTELLVAEKAEEFDRYFTEIKSTLTYVASTREVMRVLRDYTDMSTLEKYEANMAVQSLLGNLNIFKAYLDDIFVIGTNGYYTNLLSYSEMRADCDPLSWDSIRDYSPGTGTYFCYVLPWEIDCYVAKLHKVFSVVLPIFSNRTLIGYVQGNMGYRDLLRKFQTSKNIDGMEIMVINERGEVVFSEDESAIGRKCEKDYLASMTENSGTFEYAGEERELVVYRKSEITNWYFLASTTYSSLLSPGYALAKSMLLGVLPATLLLMGVIIFYLSLRIRKPVQKLLVRVEEADPEHYEPGPSGYGVLEIDALGEHFERSMERIHTLIQNVYQAELRKKDAEFAVMRDQITPHFMYNSLQLIKAEALLSGKRDISRTITSLANLLRYSMDTRTSVVTLSDEFSYIGDYLEIYRRRYVDKFSYELSPDKKTLGVKVPKPILQPLVENSIKHGLRDRTEGGRITVTSRPDGADCIVEVRDNGSGMAPERLDEVREMLRTEADYTGREIGVGNVHRRILLVEGKPYGITSVESGSAGTVITLRLRGDLTEPDKGGGEQEKDV